MEQSNREESDREINTAAGAEKGGGNRISRDDIFVRTRAMFGDEAMERLYKASVAVFGIGGVGGHAVEALARAGIGRLALFDSDAVALFNLNRQLAATLDSLGRYKTDVMRERILSINPEARVETYHCFYLPENADQYDLAPYDYIVDAVDTVAAKVELIVRAKRSGVPVISCMGAGNKLDPTRFRVADIYETSVCPLARVMRRELKAKGIKSCKVVYSTEPPIRPSFSPADGSRPDGVRRDVPGSNSFVPAAAGLILAGAVIRDIAGV